MTNSPGETRFLGETGFLGTPRWLHAWAVVTVCVTAVLLLSGAEVTTRQVGMADPEWPTAPWHLLLVSWLERGLGFLIEHSHRLAGYTAGCCVIVLAGGLWLTEPRRWLCWLGLAALAAVSVQGVLGGFRVRLHALMGTDLALVHGCFAQVVFALLVSIALFTSRGWGKAVEAPARLRRGSLLLVGLVYGQVVLGAVLRHKGGALGQRGHLLMAFAVVAVVAWLAKAVADAGDRRLQNPVKVLIGLVVVQLTLGVEAWLIKFSPGAYGAPTGVIVGQYLVRSAHVLTGALILGTSVVLALRANRKAAREVSPVAAMVGRLEGAA